MNLRIASGGQSGADQGALRAAKAKGVPTGGWIMKGFYTEDGPKPELAEYGLKEIEGYQTYPHRTKANVRDADAVLWFGNPHSPGGKLTLRLAQECNLDTFVVYTFADGQPREVADWIFGHVLEGEEGVQTLMVAGNRESKSPGIGAQVEAFLGEVLDLLKESP